MKKFLLFTFFFTISNVYCQTQEDINNFIIIFKQELKNYDIGKIEEHFNEGYFVALVESDYFNKGTEIGITSIFKTSYGKSKEVTEEIIQNYLEQQKKLKLQRKELEIKMKDFKFIQPLLKIRYYSADQKSFYEEDSAIIRYDFTDMINVVVLDLPDGIGSLNKQYLNNWNKSEEEVYEIAKENTLNYLKHKFEKAETFSTGEEIYLLTSDYDLFITSSILNLKKYDLPLVKYETLISIPNNIVIAALPLNDKDKIQSFAFNFYGLTTYMNQSKETKPISSRIYWFDGMKFYDIHYLSDYQKLAFPEEMKDFFEK